MGVRIIKAEGIPESRQIIDPLIGPTSDKYLEPPYSPLDLITLAERSSVLPQCVAAMVAGCERPHIFAPRDPKKQDNAEWDKLDAFFSQTDPEGFISFIELRRRTRIDLEFTANAYWEVVRNRAGEVVGFKHMPSHTMRMTKADTKRQEVPIRQVIGGKIVEQKVLRTFRRFVQIRDNQKVWFKEWQEPRQVNPETGEYDESLSTENAATEVIHFKIFSPRSPYGIPRWAGTMPGVAGNRAAEEVNYMYFDNKAIPPMAILVSGGALGEDSVKTLQDYINTNIKGRGNFHSILLLEAEPTPQNNYSSDAKMPQVRIEFKSLMDAQQNDAQFLKYDESNQRKVRSSFRLPPLLVGLSDDYTRATAFESVKMAEEHVFQPERDAFDYFINRFLIQEFGIVNWIFQTRGISLTDPDEIESILNASKDHAALAPDEVREVIQKPLGLDLEPLPDDLGKLPLQFRTQQQAQSVSGVKEETEVAKAATLIKSLWGLRQALTRDEV